MSGKAVKKFTAFLFVAPANLFERRRKQKRWSALPTFPDSNSLHGRRRQAGERRSPRSARVNPARGGQPEPSRAQRHRRRTPPRRQERGPRDRAASRSRNKESNDLVSNGLLIRPMKMETQREVARREPPAAGLEACLHRIARRLRHPVSWAASYTTESPPSSTDRPCRRLRCR